MFSNNWQIYQRETCLEIQSIIRKDYLKRTRDGDSGRDHDYFDNRFHAMSNNGLHDR